MMHRRQFEAVAEILAAVRDRYNSAEAREAVEVIEGDLCRVFKRENPAFDAERFKRASWPSDDDDDKPPRRPRRRRVRPPIVPLAFAPDYCRPAVTYPPAFDPPAPVQWPEGSNVVRLNTRGKQ